MGAVTDNSPRLLWLCTIGFCFLLLVNSGYPVSAESKLDSDLVFDTLDHSKNQDNINRISRTSLEEASDEHWLSSTVGRLKRSISDLFNKNEKNDNKHQATTTVKRTSRQTDDLGQQEASEDYDDVDKHIYNKTIELKPDSDNGIDDEDTLIHSGQSGDGDAEEDYEEVESRLFTPTSRTIYVRFAITVVEPYVAEFADRNSPAFARFTNSLVADFENLLKTLPGHQTATVISIQKQEADPFHVTVMVDVGSKDYSDSENLIDVVESQINKEHRIGKYTVLPNNFYARKFEVQPRSCSSNELPCKNGKCVPSESRCNGINNCDDNSDEEGCDLGGSGEGGCRADDFVRCADGSRSICADQICDGTPDCSDGWDERNCTIIEHCALGEFACDVNRCIPSSKRCDGVKDCSDESDEIECPECKDDELRCDRNKCIPRTRVCDRVQDCLDAADERNCTESQTCPEGQFSCGDGRCIPESLKCDGRPDCTYGQDEQNCIERCKDDQFTCDSGLCIPIQMRCDRVYDCGDNSDERNCPCKDDDFHCANGFCIPQSQRCDGVHNCNDQSDEIGCAPQGLCPFNEWRCNNGNCIALIKRCNRQRDCDDNSDEEGCTFCKPDEFKCNNGTCLNLSKRCNQFFDCLDHEDETNCAYCQEGQFRCDNGDCIDMHLHCDKKQDCSDGSDELKCHGLPTICQENEFQCAAGFCIMGYKRCNGINDCPSGNDEENCPASTPESLCAANEFHCNDGVCFDKSFRCDGMPDCFDKSDEQNCDELEKCELRCADGSCVGGKRCDRIYDCLDGSDEENCGFCDNFQFRCDNGQCIRENARCDGISDCSDHSDEANCRQCPQGTFTCISSGLCLDERRRCDGIVDCQDHSDEENCHTSLNITCNENEFNCGDSCIDAAFRCDDYIDCSDGSDERNCSNCRENEFACSSTGKCILNTLRCNGQSECDDGSDELDCPSVQKCLSSEFTCRNGQCIPQYLACNRRNDCGDNSDEEECRICTEPDWFQCIDGACIDISLRCDNYYDCRDFSDEQNCFASCHPHEFQCRNGQCIDQNLICDRRNDCSDGSDEQNCPTQPPYFPDLPTTTVRPYCPSGQTRCRSSQKCIYTSQLCDGAIDCPDLSDEQNCQSSSGGLNIKTYPTSQEIKENIYKPDREVVFRCRDEGPLRAEVRWTRPHNEPLPPGSRDLRGRLEIPNIKVEHSGEYICEAVGFPPNTPGAQVTVHLQVDKWIQPTYRPPTACNLHEATCSNGDCIDKKLVCDGKYDCTDGSDENRCNPNGCEPNEFRCANKKCVSKTWRCDSDDDCGDGSDEANCATNPPGSLCAYHQFTCHSNNQCIPKSFHCDTQRDCVDGSDEIGCSIPVISKPPPPMVTLDVGSTFEITCTAVGVPTPEIVWRLNWGHIPAKCRTTSQDGFGTLICENIQIEDQGAYSCEALSIKKSVLAVPDTILVVKQHTVCRNGYFNSGARSENECIKCFCFGNTDQCHSADLYVHQFQPPFDSLKLLGVRLDPITKDVDIKHEPIYDGIQPILHPVGSNGVQAVVPVEGPNRAHISPYFSMPENYHGNQLKSYGGYLKYNIYHTNRGYQTVGPDVILTGNGYTLLHQSEHVPLPNTRESMSVRFFEGEWLRISDNAPFAVATREEIMMALADITNILIKVQYNRGNLNTTLTNIEMDTAAAPYSDLGSASYVEECVCPAGYTGTSCERCADGFIRRQSGPWLGQCYREEETCAPGYYGDPARGIPCEVCPCPLTNPGNQFARTCYLGSDGDVICNCPQGYVGRRCEKCDVGYVGNPMVPGGNCRINDYCSVEGSVSGSGDGTCHCKENTMGPTCNECKPNTFHLNSETEFGCVDCFCMGVTDKCTSSNWFRDQITSRFTNSLNDFSLVDSQRREEPIVEGIRLNSQSLEIAYSNFESSNVYYWSLPSRYLGNKITSYGGKLRYTIKHTPIPGGQISKNSAADVELISANNIILLHYSGAQIQPSNSPQNLEVPLLEQYWQRHDGQKADREHLLMALADLEHIYIKATYYTNTEESSLISVSLDIADERNTGSLEKALLVEQCLCPVGYRGLSCEDCDIGYTRTGGGLYLGLCSPCECNGNSRECDPETGSCLNCRNYTTGDNCEVCLPGYEGDPGNNIPCRYPGSSQLCTCDPRGSVSTECSGGACHCKLNVEGVYCDTCRVGTFGLSSNNTEGCEVCFCSGVVTDCAESNLYIEQIPSQIIDATHGFILTDENQRHQISENFDLNPSMNEIGYHLSPSNQERLFWSLPHSFTGRKIKSYGGKLEFYQTYSQRPGSRYIQDKDIIISGNGITIYWSNPIPLYENSKTKISVALHPNEGWKRYSHYGVDPASKEDILTVLANVNAILIRATVASETESTYLSDLTLDTAVEQYTSKGKAFSVEECRCPQGYKGSSCESCAFGYYRDTKDLSVGPLGSCNKCPCNGREKSCSLDINNNIICDCLPGYQGTKCEIASTPIPTVIPIPTPDPPTIEVTISAPKIEIFEVGSSVRYTCYARSRFTDHTNVKWSKDGGYIPTHAIDDGRGLLVITNLKVSDSGRYICEASDGHSVVTKTVVLTVGESPETSPTIAINPPYIQAQEGQVVEVRCAATGNPAPNLRLQRKDGRQLSPYHSFDNGEFRISQVQKSDEGQYECIAENRVGYDVKTFTIQIRSDIPGSIVRVNIQPERFTGRSGETVILKCVAYGNIANIRWSKKDSSLPYNSREDRGQLIIIDAKPEDSGEYICRVNTYSGTSGSNTAVVMITGSNEGVYPTASVTPESITIQQGSSTELKCHATGFPTPVIKWTKLDSELGRNAEQIGSNLYIHNARLEDRGVYVCVSTNEKGLAQASTVVEVNRFEVPLLEVYPHSTQTVIAGSNPMLQCRAISGTPSPTITWTRSNGEPLNTNVEQMSSGVLKFTSITPSEEGEYTCTAENDAGRATALATIIVQTQPELWIIPSQEVIRKTVGDSIKLECHGTGNPKPTIFWEKYDSNRPTVYEAMGRVPQSIAVQEIIRLSKSDEGLYICRGENSAGITEKRIQLVVDPLPARGDITGQKGEDPTSNTVDGSYKENEHGHPDNPPIEKITAIVGTGAQLRCRINNHDEREPVFVHWIKADNTSLPPEAFIRAGVLYIDRVQPSSAGIYKCLGTSQSSGQVVFSLTRELEVISPLTLKLYPERQVVHPGDNAYIQCIAMGEAPITITWHPVGRSMPSSVYTRDGFIQFNNIQLNDTGRYRCSARNRAGEADSVADVIVEENIRNPVLTAEQRQQTAPLGSAVTLRCRSQNPNARHNIRWYRENQQLPRNSRIDGEILHIFNLEQEDRGRYFCEIPTEGGSVNDYIDLQVSHIKRSCADGQWLCNNLNCVPLNFRCDKTDDCGDASDELDCGTRIRRGPDHTDHQPVLIITPDQRDYRAGDYLNINCQSSEPGVIATWSKVGGWLEDNVQTSGGTLRINRLKTENSGLYRCEATGHQGLYNKDFDLNVIDDYNVKDEAPVVIKRAARGATVRLDCVTDLENPVTYTWSKQGGNLPSNVDIYSRSIQLENVGSMDAGSYECAASSGRNSITVPMILVVTGIVPYFTQAPTSYIQLNTLSDAYLQFNFEISFKPENGQGLILYNGNKGSDRKGDFIALKLVNSVPEFSFNLGHSTTTISGDAPLNDGEWHTIKINRNRKKVTMYVDGEGPFIGNAEGKYIGLDLNEPLYLGGVPDFEQISPEVYAIKGFVGCISRFKIGHGHIDILQEAINKQGITNCETCAENKCQNKGACQEALSKEGYSCICPAGFSGPTCNKLKGEACSPYACGTGRCIDTENSFECLCPLGKSGKRCEREITVNEPAFSNGAYMAYPPPKPIRRLKVTLKIKPKDTKDGILFYSGETDEGHGDFVSLAIKDKHVEFRFDVGTGPNVIRDTEEIVPGRWHVISAIRSFTEGRLIVDGRPPVNGKVLKSHKTLNLLTPIYIGGFDTHRMRINQGVGVDTGFNGCITDLNVSGLELSIVQNVTDAVNVQDCSEDEEDNNLYSPEYAHENVFNGISYDSRKTGCSSNPCRHGGQCYPLSPTDYQCSCLPGYGGKDCEDELNPCSPNPCQHQASCIVNGSTYSCNCNLGYTGTNCEQRAELRNDVHFEGNGYLAFPKSLLSTGDSDETQLVAIELSTNSSNGLIFWFGQHPETDGQGQDYISLSVIDGYLEYSFDLGSGPAIIRNKNIRVDDGLRHSIVLKRQGRMGSIDVDNTDLQEGESEGVTNTLNCDGDIYLGGTPNIYHMTGGRFSTGFVGCIHGFELQDSKTLDLGIRSIQGLNVKPCSRFEDPFSTGDNLVY